MQNVVYKYLYDYLHDNNILSHLQSGFRSGDWTVYQLLDFYHNIGDLKAVDEGSEVRAIFFDISKAFDKVVKIVRCGWLFIQLVS